MLLFLKPPFTITTRSAMIFKLPTFPYIVLYSKEIVSREKAGAKGNLGMAA
jgi:hypothetical protein